MKLLVISRSKIVAKTCLEDLKAVFINSEIESIDFLDFNISLRSELDESFLYLFTNENDQKIFQSYHDNLLTHVLERHIVVSKLKLLLELPANIEVLLVNNSYESCHAVIEELKDKGITYLKYIPFYPGVNVEQKIRIAVTTGEIDLVPEWCNRIIDLGSRRISVKSIMTILEVSKLLLDNVGTIEKLIDNNESQISMFISGYSRTLQKYIKVIVDSLDDGFILIDGNEHIVSANEKICNILGLDYSDLIGNPISMINFYAQDNILKVGDASFLIESNNFISKDWAGRYLLVKPVEKIEYQEKTIRISKSTNYEREHNNFSIIIGNSKAIGDAIKIAKNIAKAKGNVLIEGESGTGKELFAKAIHYTSERKNGPFIPINFSSMVPSILESELFGYEEGSFTGAKRGGKMGLFEAAKGGTLFLDEIGDANIDLQKHLLRVLQEKRIRRIGSIDQIPIDVRIISATNRSLYELVQKKEFREDLFYRINILPIQIPPLRSRKEDIISLITYYCDEISGGVIKDLKDLFTDNVLSYLIEYSWPGNIRQLINTVEYMFNMVEKGFKADFKDLPKYMINQIENANKEETNEMIQNKWIMKKLYYYGYAGRRKLIELALSENIQLTENSLRIALEKLKKEGYVTSHKGRAGSAITQKGIDFILENKNDNY